MGTPQLAATILEELMGRHEVVGVFTRPDAVRGRGKKLIASPVKETALKAGIDVYTPPTLKDDGAVALVESLAPDAICVAAYGCLLPREVLNVPAFGCLNVHTSLLPRWRGAAPIERAILADDDETGVCIMKMEEGLDTGPYCICRKTPVKRRYLDEMTSILGELGAGALVEALGLIESGEVIWSEQAEHGVTYAEKVGKGELDFGPDETVSAITAKVRAASDSHPSKIAISGKTMSVEKASIVNPDAAPAIGDVKGGEVAFIARRLVIGAADGVIELERVKPDGKRSMEGRSFAAGLQGIKGVKAAWGRA